MKNIFVGNLGFGVSEDSLRSLFQSHGTVDRVSIVTDRDSGRSRGFAFVEMSNDHEGNHAIEALNGMDLEGRTMNVNEARPRAERSPSSGYGGNRNSRW
jgi:RNA recognition motif-containing protein